MNNDKIKCPRCGTEITIDQAIVQRMVDIKSEKIIHEEKLKWEQENRKNQNRENKLLQEKLEIESKKREEAENKELEFIKKQTEMEDKIKHQELEIARKLQEERKLIIEKTQKEVAEKYDLQSAEMRKQLDDTKKALAEAQRKAQQGSMQTQGEVVELALEELLKQNFPHDIIEPVPKGVTGADIIHHVYLKTGQECGSIIWESKQTKAWTEEWVQKLKDDGRNIKGSILVLVSEVLPKAIKNFGLYKNIWVCNFGSVLGLTMALRSQLISNAKIVAMQTNKDEKKDILYDYLCSQSFANKIQSMVESYMMMKTSLEREKMNAQRFWSMRETQINRLAENTMTIYGEIQGIAGNSLPQIELLELESAAPEIEESKKPLSDTKNKTDQTDRTNDNQTGLF